MPSPGLLADPVVGHPPPAVELPRQRGRRHAPTDRTWSTLDIGAAVLAAVGLVVVERSGAGREGWSLVIGLVSLMPMLALSRVWRVPAWALLAAAALPASVVAVAALAPGGAADIERAGVYGYGVAAALAVAAFASSAARRIAVAGVALLVVLDQFTVSWLPWWGSGNPAKLMIGTFYWHNQFGAFCAGGAALGLGLAQLDRTRARWLGLLVAAFAGVGVMLSGSRASLFALVAAWVATLALGVWATGLRTAVLRWVGALASTLAVGAFLVSPVFFSSWGLPWGPVARRLGDGSLDHNTATRWEFWVAGGRILTEHGPLGPGLGTYGELSRAEMPLGIGLSADPHNELVRAFAEGGLAGGVAMLAVLAVLAGVALRSLPGLRVRSDVSADAARWGALVAAGVLTTHALVDFDWSYPALTALVGMCAGLAAAPLVRPRAVERAHRRALALIALALLVVASLGGALLQRSADLAIATPNVADDELTWRGWAPDHRLALRILSAEVAAGRADSQTADWARDALAARATVDSTAALDVARSLVLAGHADDGVDLARVAALMGGERSAPYALQYADIVREAGDETRAADIAAWVVARQNRQVAETQENRELAVEAALPLAGGSVSAQQCVEAVAAGVVEGKAPVELGTECEAFVQREVLP